MVPSGGTVGIEPGDPRSRKVDAEGFVDTEYPCRLDRDGKRLIVGGPAAGLVNVGGYRFAWRELQDLLAELSEDGSLAALPDRLAGHRLAGVAKDRERVRRALEARGVNPLLVAADARLTEVAKQMTTRFNASAPGVKSADQVLARIARGLRDRDPRLTHAQSILQASQTPEFSKAHREERDRKMIEASLRYG